VLYVGQAQHAHQQADHGTDQDTDQRHLQGHEDAFANSGA
jgi:hypothetical protein